MKKIIGCLAWTSFALVNANEDNSCCSRDQSCQTNNCQCIDSCYTLPFYDLQCDCGFFATVDFLYWYAKDSNLVFAQKTTADRIQEAESFLILPAYYNMPNKVFHMDEKWDPGVRVGIGWNTFCDGWDLYVNWTFFSNKSKKSESVSPIANGSESQLLLNPWANPIFGTDFHLDPFDTAFYGFAPVYTVVKASWKERLNIIDLEIGRKYWLSQCMTMRPFMGLRGAWDRNRFNIFSRLENVTMGAISTNLVKFKNNFWGVGAIVGFQPNWYFTSCFSFFGNADIGLLWGRCENKRNESISLRLLELDATPINIPAANGDTSSMLAILDLAIGMRFESNFCCDRYHAALDVGWEQHIWFNHNRRFQLRDGFGGLSRDSGFSELGFISATLDEIYSDLVFGGVTVKVRFDF